MHAERLPKSQRNTPLVVFCHVMCTSTSSQSCSSCCLNITPWCGQVGDPPDEGNTMAKVWRQVLEKGVPAKEGFIHHPPKPVQKTWEDHKSVKVNCFRNLCQQFQKPPLRREPPSPKLRRKAFLLAEAENIEDYRTPIVFRKVLKYDATKKICKKLSGDGKRTAE